MLAVSLLMLVAVSVKTVVHDDGSVGGNGGGPVPGGGSKAEQRFGVTPTRNAKVTYQPDVVLIGGGADAVVAQSNSGVSVVLKKGAPGVADLKPGKILFATGRIVGRVVATTPKGDGVEVVMTPVQITDVIRDANLSYDQPIDMKAMRVYQGQVFDEPDATTGKEQPGQPAGADTQQPTTRSDGKPISSDTGTDTSAGDSGASTDTSAGDSGQSSAPPVGSGSRAPGAQPVALALPAADPGGGSKTAEAPVPGPTGFPGGGVSISGFDIKPLSSGGAGVQVTYDKGGTKLLGSLQLKLASPTIKAGITIAGGGVTSASLRLGGAAGVKAHFEAGTETGLGGNINEFIDVPLDITIPLGGPVPLSLTWRNTFILKTAFSAKNSTINGTGDYSFGGSLGFTYTGSSFVVDAPSAVTSNVSMVESLNGVSLGVTGLVLVYRARAIVGIGAFGFAAGMELSATTSWGVSRSSDIGMLPCRRVDLTMSGTAGIGWAIPKPLAKVINLFLSIFKAKIPSSGGIRSAPVEIAKGTGIVPNSKACGGG